MFIDGRERRADRGILSKSGEGWVKAQKKKKEVIPYEEESSAEMKSVHKETQSSPLDVG